MILKVLRTVDTLLGWLYKLDEPFLSAAEAIILSFALTSQTRLMTELALLLSLVKELAFSTRGLTREIYVEDI